MMPIMIFFSQLFQPILVAKLLSIRLFSIFMDAKNCIGKYLSRTERSLHTYFVEGGNIPNKVETNRCFRP